LKSSLDTLMIEHRDIEISHICNLCAVYNNELL
jgi:hypothetical protein